MYAYTCKEVGSCIERFCVRNRRGRREEVGQTVLVCGSGKSVRSGPVGSGRVPFVNLV